MPSPADSDRTLFIFADAAAESGAGHVMRCAVIGDAWQRAGAGRAVIVGRVDIPFARRRLEEVGILVNDRAEGITSTDVVLSDSYDASRRRHCAELTGAGLRVLVSDVTEPIPLGFDVVWNPNAYGSSRFYPGFPGEIIAGTGTVPLRDDLPRWNQGVGPRLGAALGGGKLPAMVMDALTCLQASLGDLPLCATGSWAASGWEQVLPDRPWDDLVRCDAVITAASVTLWEASAVGVPVVVLQTQEHQRMVSDYALAHGVPFVNSLEFTDALRLSAAIEEALLRARPAPHLENGAPRVVQRLLELR